METVMPKRKIKIEIFNRSTGSVVEVKEISDLGAWNYYWCHQCDTETFGWRILEDTQ